MYLNQFDVGWPRHVVDVPPRALAPKESPSLYNPISNLPTKNNEYDLMSEHVQYCWQAIRAQINWAFALNKIHQT
jgi:hypothetical protein